MQNANYLTMGQNLKAKTLCNELKPNLEAKLAHIYSVLVKQIPILQKPTPKVDS